MTKIKVKLSQKYLDELRKKHNTNTLGRILNFDTSLKLMHGEANITVRNLAKLCQEMGWELPEYLEVDEE